MKAFVKSGFLFAVMALLLPLCCNAQNKTNYDNITVQVLMPENEEISETLLSSLQDKLYEAVSLNALGSTDNQSRYVVLPVVNVVTKSATTSIPPQFVAEVEIALYFADNYTKTILSQVIVTKKAMDDSESKAVAKALKSMQAREKKIKRLFDKGKENISRQNISDPGESEKVDNNTEWILGD